jgi:hypothetical protein
MAVNEFRPGLKLPVPPVHEPVVAPPPTDPASVTDPSEQIGLYVPAIAVALGLMVIVTSSETAVQVPAGSFVLRVNKTDLATISAGLGVYMAVNEFAFGLNVPVPPVVHVPEVALPPTLPESVTDDPSQIG